MYKQLTTRMIKANYYGFDKNRNRIIPSPHFLGI